MGFRLWQSIDFVKVFVFTKARAMLGTAEGEECMLYKNGKRRLAADCLGLSIGRL